MTGNVKEFGKISRAKPCDDIFEIPDVVVLDFDDVCYENSEDPNSIFNVCFALAANTLTGMKVSHALKLAMKGWVEHTDTAHWIAYVAKQMHAKLDEQKLRAHLDSVSHRILPTKTWSPYEGMADAIMGLRNQGTRVIVWTHGRREMVRNNMDRLIGVGAFHEGDIFDKQSLINDHDDLSALRKDRGNDPYHHLCAHLGIMPSQALLVDNEPLNLRHAREAGFQKGIHIITPRAQPYTNWDAVRETSNHTGIALTKLVNQICNARVNFAANNNVGESPCPSAKILHLHG